jgi:hypothetical protein
MVRRTSTLRRRGLTAYKVQELLMGRIKYPLRGYDGYGDMLLDQGRDSFTENYITDAMRQDWEANRDALMAFWRSGKSAHADDLAEFGLNIRMLPWLLLCGSRNTLPWAAKQFDTDDGLARPTGAEVRQLEAEAGNPALTPKALALLRVIRGYERRVRQLALKSDYRVARTLPR